MRLFSDEITFLARIIDDASWAALHRTVPPRTVLHRVLPSSSVPQEASPSMYGTEDIWWSGVWVCEIIRNALKKVAFVWLLFIRTTLYMATLYMANGYLILQSLV